MAAESQQSVYSDAESVGEVLPSAVLVGVPRAGTTSFHSYLRCHPDIDANPLKEINFLAWPGEEAANRDLGWVRFPVTSFEDYRALWRETGDRTGVDCSIACFYSPVAIERIRQYLGQPKLLVLLRDPTERAFSAYLNRVRKGYETRDPEAVLVPGDRAIDNGFYADRLSRFIDAFGRQNVGVWLFDDLKARPRETMADVFTHLGVDAAADIDVGQVLNRAYVPRGGALRRLLPGTSTQDRVRRALPARLRRPARSLWRRAMAPPPRMPVTVERRLRDLYRDDVERVAALTGLDLTSWTRPVDAPT